MNKQVVEGRIENGALRLRAPLHADATEVILPAPAGLGAEFVEGAPSLFSLEVAAGTLNVHQTHPDADLHGLAFGRTERIPRPDIVARKFAAILAVNLVAPVA